MNEQTENPSMGAPIAQPNQRAVRSRVLFWAAAILLLTLLLGLFWAWRSGRLAIGASAFHGIVMQSPEPAPDFTMTTSAGERASLSDFRGKVVLLYFGYTFCPDACPTTMAELKKTVKALGDESDKVQVIMVSVDPERDTPEALAEYLAHFDPSFLGMTGTEEEMMAAAVPLGIYVNKHAGSPATGYLVDHTTTVAAVDRDGYLRLIYPFNTPGEDIAADVRRLIR